MLGREEREEQRHALLRSQQILKWIEVVRELGHGRHYDALQPLAWHRVLAGLVEHLVHEGRDALLEAIRGHYRGLEAISSRPSEAIRGHHRRFESISRNQVLPHLLK